MTLDGPINGETFLTYIERFWVPMLMPGDGAAMDNLSSQKAASIAEGVRSVGARVMNLPLKKRAKTEISDLWKGMACLLGRDFSYWVLRPYPKLGKVTVTKQKAL